MKTEMSIEMVELSKLVHPEYNPRYMPADQMETLRSEMKEFGVVENIVVNRRNMHIVGGNQRCYAAELEGVTHVPVFWVDLDDTKERRLNLALNKISGKWEETKLREVLISLDGDYENIGFSSEEITDKIGTPTIEDMESPATDHLNRFIDFEFGDVEDSVPKEVYQAFIEEINRLKSILRPDEEPDAVPLATMLEAMVVNSAMTPAESLK